MVLLTFLVKACAASIVAGTAIATPVVYASWDKDVIDLSKANLGDLSAQGAASRGECWEIPATSKKSLKFLICANQDKYYLYDSSASDNSKAFTKITKIEGPKNKQVIITLDEKEGTKELTLSSNQWNGSPEKLDFYKQCYTGTSSGGQIVFCSSNSSSSWNTSIELTKFRVSK